MSTADAGSGCASGAGVESLTVGDLGEEGLLRLMTPLLPSTDVALVGNGDDCAVLGLGDGRAVVTTDVLVEGRHFRQDWSTGCDVGARAAAQNLADLAATGARPRALVVGLVMPGTTPVPWVLDVARGLSQVCGAVGAGVVGGDLSSGDSLVVAVTALGDMEGRAPVLRSGARPGDLVVHAGTLGHSAAGLDLLVAGLAGSPAILAHPQASRCMSVFRTPEPPLGAGLALSRAGATAMMDVSDSLLRDADRLARASGVLLDLELAQEPDPRPGLAPGPGVPGLSPHGARDAGTSAAGGHGLDRARPAPPAGAAGRDRGGAVPTGLAGHVALLQPVASLLERQDPRQARRRALQWVLTGGEDHGMLATVPPGALDRLPPGAQASVEVIGAVRAATPSAAPAVLLDGAPAGTEPGGQGWDHFAPHG